MELLGTRAVTGPSASQSPRIRGGFSIGKSTMSTHTAPISDHREGTVGRRLSTETKASFKTTEMIAYVAAVIGVLAAAAIVDASDFGSQEAWFYVTLLTIGYMVSRGLAKSGSRDYYDADRDDRGSDHR